MPTRRRILPNPLDFSDDKAYAVGMKLQRGDTVQWVDGYGETLEGEVLQVSESGQLITVDFCGNTLTIYACEVEKV